MPDYILRTDAVRANCIQAIQALRLDGKPWHVRIEPVKKRRTLSQNNLMWAEIEWIVAAVGRETGNDKEDLHKFFKSKFLPRRIIKVNGEAREVDPTTTTLKTHEMSEYMERIRAWCASELGLVLPEYRPDERNAA